MRSPLSQAGHEMQAGMRELLLAVLATNAQDLRSSNPELRRRAHQWFTAPEEDQCDVLGLAAVCDVLGLNPRTIVRGALARA